MKKFGFLSWPAIVLILATLSPADGAQSGTPPVSPGCSVARYDMTAEIAPAAKSLSATALIDMNVDSKELRIIRLFLHNEFAVRRVTEDGRPLRFDRPNEPKEQPMYSPSAAPLDIDLGRTRTAPETVRIEIAYDGPIRDVINGVNMISGGLVEIGAYSAWFPIEKENGNFTYRLRLTLPAGFACVTDGRLIEETASAGKELRLFQRDTAGFDIPVIAGPRLKVVERKASGITARVVYQDMPDNLARSSLDRAIRCSAYLSGVLGAAANGGEMSVVYSPRSGWGYSRSPVIVGPESVIVGRLSNEAERRENFHGLAHEAAHFWWNLAPTATSDDWINESAAEYYALRAVEDAFGEAAARDYWRDYLWAIQRLPGDKAILTTLRNDPAAYILFYRKGPILLRMLESALGRGELDRILRKIHQEHRGRRDLTTDAFLSSFERETKSSFRTIFDRFLRRGGLPSLDLEWRAEGKAASGRIGVDDAALAGFPLTLSFRGARPAERETRTVRLAAGTTPWRFDLPFEPRRIVTDPESRLLIAQLDGVFAGRLIPLVHGPEMDFDPETIPEANIEKAEAILAEWERSAGRSAVFEFEKGWLRLLRKDARAAIEAFSDSLAEREGLPNKSYYVPRSYRNIGFGYDLLNDRAAAVPSYHDGMAAAALLGVDKLQQALLFQDYARAPYPAGKSLHVAAWAGKLDLVVALAGTDPSRAVNAKDDFLGQPAILWAVQGIVRAHVVEWLVGHGADVNVSAGSGQSLLQIVKAKGESNLAAFLIAHGAKD